MHRIRYRNEVITEEKNGTRRLCMKGWSWKEEILEELRWNSVSCGCSLLRQLGYRLVGIEVGKLAPELAGSRRSRLSWIVYTSEKREIPMGIGIKGRQNWGKAVLTGRYLEGRVSETRWRVSREWRNGVLQWLYRVRGPLLYGVSLSASTQAS